jgi:hypothetical protein
MRKIIKAEYKKKYIYIYIYIFKKHSTVSWKRRNHTLAIEAQKNIIKQSLLKGGGFVIIS